MLDYIYTVPNPPVSTVHEVMLLSNALLLCAICYSFEREQPLLQYSPDFHFGLTMSESEDPDTSSRSFVKDLDNIQRMDFLLHVDLEDPEAARTHWIGLRSKTMERFGLALMYDPLWEYAANEKGSGSKRFDEPVKLKNYRGYGAKLGHPRDMQNISQQTLRFRAIAMLKAHLPSGIEWS